MNPFAECFLCIARLDPDRFLENDRPCIDPFVDEVDRNSSDLRPLPKRIPDSGCAAKGREKRRVDIENPVSIDPDKGGT